MRYRQYSFGATILGKGISSTVYKAKKQKSSNQISMIEKTYAIKCIHEEFLNNKYTRTLLQNEVQALTSLRHHQNILELIQFGSYQNNYYIVTQLCQKGSLAERLQSNKALSEAQAVYIIKELMKAYKSMFTNNYIHRDIKPGNILITSTNQIKLADFGFALNCSKAYDYQNQKAGTPYYMAPESIKSKIYNYKSDFWAIGVTFYRILTGQLPIQSFKHQKQLTQCLRQSLQNQKLKYIGFYSKEFLRLTLAARPQQRISSKQFFDFKFQRIPKYLQFSDRQLKESQYKKTYTSTKQSQIKLMEVTKASSNESNCSSNNTQNKKYILQNNLSKKMIKEAERINQNSKIQNINPNQAQSIKKFKQNKNQEKIMNNQKIQQQKINNEKCQGFSIQKCKIIQALLSQFNLVRFVNRMIYRVRKFLQNQNILKQALQKFVIIKIRQFKNVQKLTQKDAQFFKIGNSYTKWIELIEEYQSKLKIKYKLVNQKPMETTFVSEIIAQVIKKYYFSIHPSNISKRNSQILITIDFLISLKLLLDIQTTKDYQQFHMTSRIDEILQLEFPKEAINQHLQLITQKLINLNFF